MRGRKPAPTHLKLVKGTRKSRINAKEPQPAPALPSVPEHLSAEAKVEWQRVAQELYDLGILTHVDRGVLAAYCQAYGRWQRAEQAIAEMQKREQTPGGVFVISTVSGNLIQNPMIGVANKAMGDMVRYAAELGMTPSARSRIEAERREAPADPAARYLGA